MNFSLFKAKKNSETAFMLDKENAILIKSFFIDNKDQELSKLTPFLKYLSQVSQKSNEYSIEILY